MVKHELPKLPYEYNALEPHIDEQTMRTHHTKHHQTYVDKLNKAIEDAPKDFAIHGKTVADLSVEDLMMHANLLPEEVFDAVVNNGGGHANHSLFWTVLTPKGGKPEGKVADAIAKAFGDFETFKEELKQAAIGQFGSGWAWLVVNQHKELEVVSTPNQDSPLMSGLKPIFGVDVWEHAYYLKYQNKRADYLDAIWNVVNWTEIDRRYQDAMK